MTYEVDPEAKRIWERNMRADAVKPQVIVLLETWFNGMESGEAFNWFPSPKCSISIESANDVVKVIDDLCQNELTKNPNYWVEIGVTSKGVPIDANPEFSRLPEPQRLALAEQLQGVFRV